MAWRQTPQAAAQVTVTLLEFGGHPTAPVESSVEVMEYAEAGLDGTLPPSTAAGPDPMVRLFDAEAGRLISLARYYVDDKAAAEDLVQEAFIRLSRSADRIRDESRAAAYLRSIVINLARDHNRRGLMSLRHRPPSVGDEPSAEDTANLREDRRQVIAALSGLPRRQRDCLTLKYYYDLTAPEIAATLGLSVNSVKTHLQRGMRALESALEEQR